MLQSIKQLLVENLKDEISKEQLKLLSSTYQKIGDIVIVDMSAEIEKFDSVIGKIILKYVPNTRTVCKKTGDIHGKERIPNIEVIAGDKNMETIHKENGCLYKLDVSRLMFSKGNLKERGRLPKLIKEGELVVDMFSGMGYFSIPIAKFSKIKKIYSIDINPTAILYLEENIRLNRSGGKIYPIIGDCRNVVKKLGKVADRVVMGYLPETRKFLDSAFLVLKESGGIIHYHDTFKESDLWSLPVEILKKSAEKNGYKLKKITEQRIVKSYAPKVCHIVMDAEFSKMK